MKLSAQLYTVLGYITEEAEFAESLRKIKKIGYDYVQYLDATGLSAVKVKSICDDAGMKISSSHFDFDEMFRNTDKYIESNKIWNTSYIGTGAMPERFRDSADGFKEFAEKANILGEKFRREGIKFTYHNHWFEFKDFGGRTGFDILIDETCSNSLFFEVDVCWAKYGNQDPAALLKRLAGRIEHIHFKDLLFKDDGGWQTAEVGSGILNWPEIAEAAEKGGTVFAAVEQDVCQGDPFDSLEKSFKFISTLNI